jgi:hypothetical protein
MKYEYCCKCDCKTGKAGADEDSLYTEHEGPFCESCFPDQAAQPAPVQEQVAVELERIAQEPPVNGNNLAQARVLMAAQRIRNATPPAAQPAPVEPLEYWNAVEGWVKIDEVREHFDSVGCGTIYKTAGDGRVPLTAAQRQWTGLTDDEIDDLYQGAGKNDLKRAREIEAKLRSKNT